MCTCYFNHLSFIHTRIATINIKLCNNVNIWKILLNSLQRIQILLFSIQPAWPHLNICIKDCKIVFFLQNWNFSFSHLPYIVYETYIAFGGKNRKQSIFFFPINEFTFVRLVWIPNFFCLWIFYLIIEIRTNLTMATS